MEIQAKLNETQIVNIINMYYTELTNEKLLSVGFEIKLERTGNFYNKKQVLYIKLEQENKNMILIKQDGLDVKLLSVIGILKQRMGNEGMSDSDKPLAFQ